MRKSFEGRLAEARKKAIAQKEQVDCYGFIKSLLELGVGACTIVDLLVRNLGLSEQVAWGYFRDFSAQAEAGVKDLRAALSPEEIDHQAGVRLAERLLELGYESDQIIPEIMDRLGVDEEAAEDCYEEAES